MRQEPGFNVKKARGNASNGRGHASNAGAGHAGAGTAVLRMTGVALDNPVAAGGTLVMLLTSCLIVANALSFQPGKHPAPLFSTRTAAIEDTAQPMRPQPSDLVTDLQNSLKRIGYYSGPVDGLNGPRTEEAIRSYERASGLAVTGRPSHALRARLILEDVALPRAAPTPPTGSSSSGMSAVPVPVPPGEVGSASSPTGSIGNALPRETVRSAQSLLDRLGYGPVTVDGLMGGETASAVRRFQLDRGLSLDGQLGTDVLAALEKVSGQKIPR
ncbi:peptidoglycan-binding domain-containing protein [Breoghania sp.]|uniref:peptidoglycan-binding domain-containing protein n=1 Tax=Breoghania sp. TaxID=2065378 RepID=UPI002AA88A2C|nr:peptidoglycan-binding domain-containing protein [Breoghania sp.]